MFLIIIHVACATFCLNITRISLRRALPFMRAGWLIIAAETNKPDYRYNVESRRNISTGGSYLIGGILWGFGAIVAAVASALFGLEAWRLMLG